MAYPFIKDEAFFGVFDGHSTTFVAEYLVKHLYEQIKLHPNYNDDIHKAIREGIIFELFYLQY